MKLDRYKKIKKTELDLIAYNKIDKIKLVKTKDGYKIYHNDKSYKFDYDECLKRIKTFKKYSNRDIMYYNYKGILYCEKYNRSYSFNNMYMFFNRDTDRITFIKGQERLVINSFKVTSDFFNVYYNGQYYKVIYGSNNMIVFDIEKTELEIYDTSLYGVYGNFRLTINQKIFNDSKDALKYVKETLEPSLCYKFKI